MCVCLCVSVCAQNELTKKVTRSRKQMKERRKRTKKIRGVKKNAGEHGAASSAARGMN